MIATVIAQHPSGTSSGSNLRCMRDSNLAGAPLLVPRRTTRPHTLPASQSASRRGPCISTSCQFLNQGDSDSDSGSGSASTACKSTIRLRRGRVKALPPSDPNLSKHTTLPLSLPETFASPVGQLRRSQTKQERDVRSRRSEATIAAPRPLVYTPGALRLSVETIRSHMFLHPPHLDSRSNSGNGSKSAPPQDSRRAAAGGSPPVLRKKSGQPVKPSLKTSRTSTRGNLSIVTVGSSSKSEPPTPKAVHFDTKLEHVKLFLSEQKPLAVSRDGSPTEDTSGTDSDFPPYIYGENDDMHRSRKRLAMRPINPPPRRNPAADVVLEDFYLNFDGTSILGKVRVRNMAFAKSVTVRFTFDSWQTTSEVTGQYAESIDSQFDRFSFSIRLNDLLARIEGKTFIMAIRYNVAGKEFWDNNSQQNYVATFTRTKIVPGSRKLDDEDASDVENLRNRLEQVVLQDKEKGNTLACPSKKLAMSQSKETDPPSFKSNISFSSRYDFTTSLRNPTTWKSSDIATWGPLPMDARMLSQSAKSVTPPVPPSSIPFPEKISPAKRPAALPVSPPSFEGRPSLGSPRDINEAHLLSSPLRFRVRPNDSTGGTLSSGAVQSRNHRRSYSDTSSLSANSSVKLTPPGTPPSKPLELSTISCQSASSQYYSFPPLMTNDKSLSSSSPSELGSEFTVSTAIRQLFPASLSSSVIQNQDPGSALGEFSGESELSTSSLTTPTSSRSPTPSPTDPFMKRVALPPLDSDAFDLDSGFGLVEPLPPASPGTHYRQFLNKFCFFTGAQAVDAVPDAMEGSRAANPIIVDTARADKSVDGSVTQIMSLGEWGSRPGTPVPS